MQLSTFIYNHTDLNLRQLSKIIGTPAYRWSKIPYKYRLLLSKRTDVSFPLGVFKQPTDYGLAQYLNVSKQLVSLWRHKKIAIPVAYKGLIAEFYQIPKEKVPLVFAKKETHYWKCKRV